MMYQQSGAGAPFAEALDALIAIALTILLAGVVARTAHVAIAALLVIGAGVMAFNDLSLLGSFVMPLAWGDCMHCGVRGWATMPFWSQWGSGTYVFVYALLITPAVFIAIRIGMRERFRVLIPAVLACALFFIANKTWLNSEWTVFAWSSAAIAVIAVAPAVTKRSWIVAVLTAVAAFAAFNAIVVASHRFV